MAELPVWLGNMNGNSHNLTPKKENSVQNCMTVYSVEHKRRRMSQYMYVGPYNKSQHFTDKTLLA